VLRFALHSPGSPVGSARLHRMPCGDVDSSVHISVEREPAGPAPEPRLALSRFRRYVPARPAPLTREHRANLLNPAGSLLLQPGNQQSPPRPGQLPVQPGILPHIPARLGDRASCRPGHGQAP